MPGLPGVESPPSTTGAPGAGGVPAPVVLPVPLPLPPLVVVVAAAHAVVAAAATAARACTSRLVVPVGAPTTLAVDVDASTAASCAGVRHGLAARMSATTPATCGAAMLVPLQVAYASAALMLLYTPTPGA